jgi:hypothetical protein
MSLKRVLFAVAFFLTVFVGYRQVRTELIQAVGHIALRVQQADHPVQIYGAQRTSLYVIRTDVEGNFERWAKPAEPGKPASMSSGSEKNLFVFTGFGDKYFLLGGVFLFLVGVSWMHVLRLLGLHLLITVAAFLFLLLALIHSHVWLYVMNFTISYITPFLTMLYVIWAWRGNGSVQQMTDQRVDL